MLDAEQRAHEDDHAGARRTGVRGARGRGRLGARRRSRASWPAWPSSRCRCWPRSASARTGTRRIDRFDQPRIPSTCELAMNVSHVRRPRYPAFERCRSCRRPSRCRRRLPCGTRPRHAAPDARIAALAAKEKQPLLDTLKQLVLIESGSRDLEGLDKIADLIAERLKRARRRGRADRPEPPTSTAWKTRPRRSARSCSATFKGTGTQEDHADRAHGHGLPERHADKQPFRIDGDKAYGLGIADDKQGIAVILHAVAMLKAARLQGVRHAHGADQRRRGNQLAGLARAHHAAGRASTTPCSRTKAPRSRTDKLSLATAGIASVTLKVTGKASHAGSAPERGVNALYELAHQILQMRDLSDPATGLKMNWTIAQAGTNRNVIPAMATAERRRARAEGRRLRPHREAGARARQEAAGARGQGRDAASSAAARRWKPTPPRSRWRRHAQGIYRRTRPRAGRRRQGGRRRHRRRLRRRSRPRPAWSSASACRASARIRPMPNTCCSTRSSRGSICRRR